MNSYSNKSPVSQYGLGSWFHWDFPSKFWCDSAIWKNWFSDFTSYDSESKKIKKIKKSTNKIKQKDQKHASTVAKKEKAPSEENNWGFRSTDTNLDCRRCKTSKNETRLAGWTPNPNRLVLQPCGSLQRRNGRRSMQSRSPWSPWLPKQDAVLPFFLQIVGLRNYTNLQRLK